MNRDVPVLLAEDDLDTARRALARCDRALVVTPSGELLDVITAVDLRPT